MQEKVIHIYTDGSSRGNPGPAGWASVFFTGEGVVELGGREETATNNQMELKAVLESLLYIEEKKLFMHPIAFFIDSSYVQKGITEWMYGWEKNGWLTKENKPVLNKELWEQALFCVFRLKSKAKITFEKVAGHADVFGNEEADRLATSFADALPTPLFKGSLSDYKKLILSKPKKTTTTTTKKKSFKSAYAYISFVGGKIYSDKDWATCEKRVKGKNARYRKVFSKEEEKEVMHEFSQYL